MCFIKKNTNELKGLCKCSNKSGETEQRLKYLRMLPYNGSLDNNKEATD